MIKKIVALIIAAGFVSGIARTARAVDYTWTGAADQITWANAGNWDVGGTYPDDNADKAIIPAALAHSITTPAAGITIGELDMQAGCTATITLGGALTNDNAGGHNGNLTITAGTLNSNGNTLTVDGAASVTGTLIGGASAISFGSLTINSGGTYSATSGTTTLSGTFDNNNGASGITHNNGTITMATPAARSFYGGGGTYYNITSTGTERVYIYETLTVENALGYCYRIELQDGCNLSMGTATSAGTISASYFRTYSGSVTIQSVNESYKCSITPTMIMVGYSATSTLSLKWVSVAGDVWFYARNNNVVRLVGDSNFNTFSFYATGTGSKIDVNGYTLSATGSTTVTSSHILDLGGGNIIGTSTFTLDSGASLVPNGTIEATSLTDNNARTISSAQTLTLADTPIVSFSALTIDSGGTYIATGGTTTITNETAGGYAFDNDGALTNSSGAFTFTYAGATKLDTVGTSGNLYDVILNNAALDITLDAATTIDNDLTITAGTLNTDTGAAAVDLTVTGDASISGTLDAANFSASAISFGSLTIPSGNMLAGNASTITCGGDWTNSGTFTCNTSTNIFTTTANVDNNNQAFYGLTVDAGVGTVTLAAGKVSAVSNLLWVKSGTCHTDDNLDKDPVGAGTWVRLHGANTIVCGVSPQIDADATLEAGGLWARTVFSFF